MIYCFDIGGSFIKYGVPGADGLVPELGRVKTPLDDFEAFVAALKFALSEMPRGGLDAVSISLAGFADPVTGEAVVANIPCLSGHRLDEELSRILRLPVRITNDADCFALAEASLGAARGHANVFAIILGSGLGGGLVIDGRLVAGHGGIAGEWGHSPIVDPTAGGLVEEPLPVFACGCGRKGCLDTVGGARGLERVHEALHGDFVHSAAILTAWQSGDSAAERTVAVYIENVARALNLIVNTVGVDSVPVGGGLAGAPALVARLDKRVRELALASFAEPLVVPGLRAADGGLVGAALAGADLLGEAA